MVVVAHPMHPMHPTHHVTDVTECSERNECNMHDERKKHPSQMNGGRR